MPRCLLLALAAFAFCFGQNAFNPREFSQTLNFEIDQAETGPPKGWGGGVPNTVFIDREVVHGGKHAARIERNSSSANTFTAITKMLPVDFAGKVIELKGFLRTEAVSEYSGLWMRLDGEEGMLSLENMQSRNVKGTTAWTEYSITLPLQNAARQVFFGALSSGTGKTWIDDLELLVDGKPVWEAPKVERPKSILEQDQEFDSGSKIKFTQLTAVQIENLKTLGKVWGFLKYHDPAITAGKRHWDYELFRILPAVLAATGRAEANREMANWAGKAPACTLCAKLDGSKLHLRPDIEWLGNTEMLGGDLSSALKAVHLNRHNGRRQFYVSLNPGVGNPSFDHEPAYNRITLPDAGFQLLALFRFWNIIEYWFPYRDVIGENWDKVLAEFIPRIALAKTPETYQQELMALIARAGDTHANLWSSITARPPVGACRISATIRYVENQPVVSTAEEGTGLQRGDVLLALDGKPVTELFQTWLPYYAASNEPTKMRDLTAYMTRGPCGAAVVRLRRGDQTMDVATQREKPGTPRGAPTHDRPGETFQKLSKEIAYLKLSSVNSEKAASYIDSAAGTKGLIIDIRNYPSSFMVFALGSLLVDRDTDFVRFTNGDPSNPGAFHWTEPIKLQPAKPHYGGKVILLIDEVSQSQSEYTTMAFRSSPRATVIGSTTAGADGNVSTIPIPGGFRSMISGIGVFYPDKRPTQRIGILPDIEVKPTIAGIREGRDEVLEEAIRQIEKMP